MKGSTIAVILIVLALGAGGYYLYSQGNIPGMAQPTPTPEVLISPTPVSIMEDEEATAEGTSMLSEEDEEVMDEDALLIEMDAFEYGYTPEEISVEAGQKVVLKVINTGDMSHDWILEGEDIQSGMLSPGDSDTIEFTLDEPGEYTFYCSVGNHRALGMEGTLTVE